MRKDADRNVAALWLERKFGQGAAGRSADHPGALHRQIRDVTPRCFVGIFLMQWEIYYNDYCDYQYHYYYHYYYYYVVLVFVVVVSLPLSLSLSYFSLGEPFKFQIRFKGTCLKKLSTSKVNILHECRAICRNQVQLFASSSC